MTDWLTHWGWTCKCKGCKGCKHSRRVLLYLLASSVAALEKAPRSPRQNCPKVSELKMKEAALNSLFPTRDRKMNLFHRLFPIFKSMRWNEHMEIWLLQHKKSHFLTVNGVTHLLSFLWIKKTCITNSELGLIMSC